MPPFTLRPLPALVAVGAALAAAPSIALADHGGDADAYHAAFVRQSPDLTLESGQEATSWMEARNISDNVTWSNTNVKLGTIAEKDRPSPMYWDVDWLSPQRPTFMDQASVGMNQVARFTWRVKAPTVNVRTEYKEAFGPVTEGVQWMDRSEWGTPVITYTVTPPTPPSLSIVSAPVRIRRGDALPVAARVRDDYKVDAVRFAVGAAGADGVLPDPSGSPDTYAASLPTADLPAGFHTLAITGTDHVGNKATITHQFEVFEPAPSPPPVFAKLDASVVLKARLIKRGRRGVRLIGLTVRAPIGSRISVSCRPTKPRRCRNQVIGATTRTVSRPSRTIRGRRLPRGSRVYVRVTKPGMIGELTRFTVGRRSVARAEYAIPAR